MKHIFVVHSNICCIVIKNLVSRLSGAGENVLIITNRGQIWPFSECVDICDFSNLYKDYYVYHISSIKDYIRRLVYLFLIKRHIKKMVNSEKYILYIPNYAVDYQTILAENKWCEGYYFIEEGTLAYTPIDYLKGKEASKSLKAKYKNLLGMYNRFYLETTEKFKGTISINENAFSWNTKEKIIEKVCIDIDASYYSYDYIIVTGFISEDLSSVKSKVNKVLDFISSNNSEKNIAIKFHPHVYYNYPQKVDEMKSFLSNCKIRVSILPQDFIVEYSIFSSNCTIISLDSFSSLNIYSVIFGRESYTLDDNIISFRNLSSCLDYITSK